MSKRTTLNIHGCTIATVFLLGCFSTQASAQFFADDEKAWGAFHKTLLDRLSPGQALPQGSVIQILPVFQRIEWDGSIKELNLFERYLVANTVPQWGGLYIPSSTSVSVGYEDFLNQLNSEIIDTSGEPNTRKLKKYQRGIERTRGLLRRLNDDAARRWRIYAGPKDRFQWEEDNGYAPQRRNYETQLKVDQAKYALEINLAGADVLAVGQALLAISNPKQLMKLPDNEDQYTLGEAAWDYYYRTFARGDIFRFLQDADPEYFRMDTTSAHTKDFYKTWGAGGRVSWCLFFSASGSTRHTDRSRQWQRDTTSVEIRFDNLKAVPIYRGRWYNGVLLRRFRDKIDPKFWDAGGGLPLIPTQLVIGHGLEVRVETKKEIGDYIYEYHHTSGGGGFSIGPFRIGGGGDSTTRVEETDIKRTDSGFSIRDKSGRGVIVAVISERQKDFIVKARFVEDKLSPQDRDRAERMLEKALQQADEEPVSLDFRSSK